MYKLWLLPLQFVLLSAYTIYLDSKCILFTLVLLIRFIVNIGFEHVDEYRKNRNQFYQSQLEQAQQTYLESYVDLIIFQLKPNIEDWLNFKKQSLLSLLFWRNIHKYFNTVCTTGSITILLIYYLIAERLDYNTLVIVYMFKLLSGISLELNSLLTDSLQALDIVQSLKTNVPQPKDVVIKSNFGIYHPNYVLHIYPNTCFQYHSDYHQRFTLRYNGKGLTLPKGGLTIICGESGSGKTSFLRALRSSIAILTLELLCTSGGIYFGQSIIDEPTPIAYCSQDPWLLNGTIRENIIFGQEFETERYYRTISCCDLISDIQSLENQDFTPVHQIELTSSFVQRVCLARAIYSDSKLVLLDDSLETVERELKKSIFERAICGFLAHKTRILVTNDVELFPNADLVLNITNGLIKPIKKFKVQFTEKVDSAVYQKEYAIPFKSISFVDYLRNAGGIAFPIFFPLLVCITQMALFVFDAFIIILIDYLPTVTDDIQVHLYILVLTFLASMSGLLVVRILNHYAGTFASNIIQKTAYHSIFLKSFVDLSKFNSYGYFGINNSRIDEHLMDNMYTHFAIISSITILGIFTTLIFDQWISAAAGLVFLGIPFFGVKYLSLAKNVNEKIYYLKKLVSKLITESELARDIATAFCESKFVQGKLYTEIDFYNRSLSLEALTKCWVSLRVDLVIGCILAVILLSFKVWPGVDDKLGLQLLLFIGYLSIALDIKVFFSNYLQTYTNFHEVTKVNSFRGKMPPAISFPSSNQIEFHNVTIATQNNEIILSKVNVVIEEGERIGVIPDGELDVKWILQNYFIAEGSISIGGVDLTQLHHSEIFNSVGIIPKYFNITCPVREFLDPKQNYSDHELFEMYE